MQAIRNKVIVRPPKKEGETTTKSGIVVETFKKIPVYNGVVVACGEDVKELVVGDKIIFDPYNYEEYQTEDEETLYVMDIDDVWAIVR